MLEMSEEMNSTVASTQDTDKANLIARLDGKKGMESEELGSRLEAM